MVANTYIILLSIDRDVFSKSKSKEFESVAEPLPEILVL
jgi:hypothetical protein